MAARAAVVSTVPTPAVRFGFGLVTGSTRVRGAGSNQRSGVGGWGSGCVQRGAAQSERGSDGGEKEALSCDLVSSSGSMSRRSVMGLCVFIQRAAGTGR